MLAKEIIMVNKYGCLLIKNELPLSAKCNQWNCENGRKSRVTNTEMLTVLEIPDYPNFF